MLRILSLGAGVQSTTILRMSIAGELPKLDGAIFADTQWEPPDVYRHLDVLQKESEAAGIPIYRPTKGNLRSHVLTTKRGHWSRPALYVLNPDGTKGISRRQCTGDFKVDVIKRQTKEILGIKRATSKIPIVEQWVGISLDEVYRMKPRPEKWIQTRWPLIELRMTRIDCKEWNKKHGFPEPPRSSCIGCPYHNDHEWRRIKANSDLWADAVDFDRRIRLSMRAASLRGEFFCHPSCVPLDQVDLSTAEDHGQLNLFNNECEGMCGV